MVEHLPSIESGTYRFPTVVRQQLATEMVDVSTEVGASLSATYATGGEVRSKGKPDGTDQTTTVQAELDALVDAGGGTLLLPVSAFGPIPIKVTKLTLKNDGATPPKQPVIELQGQGAHWSGRGTAPIGGAIIEFTGTDTYGLLKTNGLGRLVVRGVTFRNTGSGTTPFVYTTNTTLDIQGCAFVGSKTGALCDQDAIVLGGTQQVEGFAGWDDGFQGYGTVISRNFFSGIRVAVRSQAFANGNRIMENTVWTTCGNPTGAAFEFDGQPTTGVQTIAGGTVGFNLIELPKYKYGIRIKNAVGLSLVGNDFYDADVAVTTAGILFEETALHNRVLGGFCDNGAQHVLDYSGRNTVDDINDTLGISSVNSKPVIFHNRAMFAGISGQGGMAVAREGDAAYVKAEQRTNPYSRINLATKPGKIVTDAATTTGSRSITSATAAFTDGDVGVPISGAGIPTDSYIIRRVSATEILTTNLATATASGVTVSFGRHGAEQLHIGFERAHIIALGAAPVAAVAAGAGGGATAVITGTDIAGTVTITTGTSPTAGALANITAAIPFTGTTHIVLTPANAAAADVRVYAARVSSSLWQVGTGATPPPASTVLKYSYTIVQAA